MELLIPDRPYGTRCKGQDTRAASIQEPRHSQRDRQGLKTSAHPSSEAAAELRLGERSPGANERLAVPEGFAPDEVQHQIPGAVPEEEGGLGGLKAGR